jgi:hypothetical protein
MDNPAKCPRHWSGKFLALVQHFDLTEEFLTKKCVTGGDPMWGGDHLWDKLLSRIDDRMSGRQWDPTSSSDEEDDDEELIGINVQIPDGSGMWATVSDVNEDDECIKYDIHLDDLDGPPDGIVIRKIDITEITLYDKLGKKTRYEKDLEWGDDQFLPDWWKTTS